MDWLEISAECNHEGADIVSEYMRERGAAGTQIIDRRDVPDPNKPHGYWELIDPEMIEKMPVNVVVKAWFPTDTDVKTLSEGLKLLPARAGFDLGTLTLTVHGVEEKNWAEVWKKFYKPFRLGERLLVKPCWEQCEARPGDLVIELDPGMAFGTGSHETTAMCLELIEKYKTGGRLLDVGTGSGILAIAAGKLGTKEVTAVDIDPMAVRVARENVLSNGLDGVVTVTEGDLTKEIDGVFDLAVANILADVILLLLPDLERHLKPGAVFICSGILAKRLDEVLLSLKEHGYTVLETRAKGDWRAVAAKK